MYSNLRAEMSRFNITNAMLAETIDVDPATMSQKLNIPDRLKLCEAKAIQEKWFPDLSINYLFADFPILPVSAHPAHQSERR